LYRRTALMACQDGEITPAELEELQLLEEVLALPGREIRGIKEQVRAVQELAEIRAGKLPVIRSSGLLLRQNEVCHWYSKCTYRYDTKARTRELAGRLAATSQRVIFTSAERSFDFPVRDVLNTSATADAVKLQLRRTRGQGSYFVEEPSRFEAILYALVLRANFATAERTDSSARRHIPDNVKVEVWARDGGSCVRCGARDYLEYDHIIPVSKGGANTAKNVQLLCRRCNLAKGAEVV